MTCALKGSPRWAVATADVDGSLQAMLYHFSCAIGMLLKPSDIAATAHVFARMAATGAGFVRGLKDHYHRRRAYGGTGLPICLDAGRAELAALRARAPAPAPAAGQCSAEVRLICRAGVVSTATDLARANTATELGQ